MPLYISKNTKMELKNEKKDFRNIKDTSELLELVNLTEDERDYITRSLRNRIVHKDYEDFTCAIINKLENLQIENK